MVNIQLEYEKPLADLVAERLKQLKLQGYSLAAIAKRMHQAARQDHEHCAYTRQAILRVAAEGRIPRDDHLRWLAVALEVPVQLLVIAAEQQRRHRQQVEAPLKPSDWAIWAQQAASVRLADMDSDTASSSDEHEASDLPGAPGADTASGRELRTVGSVAWIADHSPLSFQDAYEAVLSEVQAIRRHDPAARHHEAYLHARVRRDQIAAALIQYYQRQPAPDPEAEFYRVRVADDLLNLSVLTKPDWLELAARLNTAEEEFRLVSPAPHAPTDWLEGAAVEAAVRRLAAIEESAAILVNNPVYRLLDVQPLRHKLTATVAMADFASYALTMDLLEIELLKALAAAPSLASGELETAARLQLRDQYLPSVASVLDLSARLCMGGPIALFAAARSKSSTGHGEPDYVLLVQERSPKVLNVTGKLAVVPKAFHSPVIEPGDEVRLSASLEREIEEELLGRVDLENNLEHPSGRSGDPFHADRLSEPMRWLVERRHTDAYRIECVGFGINVVTGNYEFPCLVVIDDEEWWARYGGRIEANWEINRIRRYSSRDTAGLRSLIAAPNWSNEGLFAFTEGLRRLADIDTRSCVLLPPITVEV